MLKNSSYLKKISTFLVHLACIFQLTNGFIIKNDLKKNLNEYNKVHKNRVPGLLAGGDCEACIIFAGSGMTLIIEGQYLLI